MADKDMKLLGKLGLDLTQLKRDMKTLENEIKKGDKASKEFGKVWQKTADDIKKAFGNFPIAEYVKALEKLEKMQKQGLDKEKRNQEKANDQLRRAQEKHLATMENQRRLYDQKIANLQQTQRVKIIQMMDKYNAQELRNQQKHFNSLNNLYKQAQKTMNPVTKRFSSLMDYAIASGSIYGTVRAFREVVKANREFEVELVNLQRILGGTTHHMEQLKDMTFEVGKATGNATKNIQTIQNLWVRTGKVGKDNMEALKEIVEVSAIGLNTTEFKNAEEAVSMLNGAINQMAEGDLSKARDILDSWAKTADYTAVGSARDLAEVISRAGSSAKMLGMDFHDLNAVTGILAERMAINGERIGTALKTVFSRFQDPSQFKFVEKWGVDILDGTGKNFREFTEIMDDLHVKIKELNDEEYGLAIAEITKALGGTRMRPIIENLIEGWDRYKEIVEVSMNSSGFAMEQNAKIMQTFDKQVEVLKVSLTELAVTVGEAGLMDVLKGLVNNVSSAVNWFNSLDNRTKQIIITTSEFLLVFGMLNTTVKKFSKVSLVELISSMTKLLTGTKNLTLAEQMLDAAVKAGTISEIQRTQVIQALRGQVALSTLAEETRTVALQAQTLVTRTATSATVALNIAITAGLAIIPMLIARYKNLKAEKELYTGETLKSIKAMNSEIENIEALIDEYDSLQSKVELTAEEKEKLHGIQVKLAEIYPDTVNGIDKENQRYTDQIELVKQLTKEKRKMYEEELEMTASKGKIEMEKLIAERDKLESELAKLQAQSDLIKDFVLKYSDLYHRAVRELNSGNGFSERTISEIQGIQDERFYFGDNTVGFIDVMEKEMKQWEKYSEKISELVEKIDENRKKRYEYAEAIVELDKLRNPWKYVTDNNTEVYSGGRTSSGIEFDPDYFNELLRELEHRRKMDELTDLQYADELQKLLDKYGIYLDQDSIWDLEEKIYSLRKDKSSSKSGTGIPALDSALEFLEHQLKMDEIDTGTYIDRLAELIAQYENQLEKKALWNLQEKLYSARKQNKPDVEQVDFDTFKESINNIEHEIKLIEKEQSLLDLLYNKKSTLIPSFIRQTEEYLKAQRELNVLNSEYSELISSIEDEINSLDPESMHYEETVKKLTEQKNKLNDEIRKNIISMIDYGIAIEKTNAKMQDMIESSLADAYNLEKTLAQQELEKRHEQEILDLKEEIFKVTKEELEQFGLSLDLLKDQEEAYMAIIEEKKKAKQQEIDQLEKEIRLQKYLNKLNEIDAEIEKVKKDTRFAYIDEKTGKEIFTYDRARVAELEEKKAEEIRERQTEELKEQLKKELNEIEEQADEIKDIYRRRLRNLEEHHKNEEREFNIYWQRRLSDERIKMDALNLIKKFGYEGALKIAEEHFDNMNSIYEESSYDAYEGGKRITEGLAEGLFADIDSVIKKYKDKVAQLNSLKSQASSLSSSSSSSSKTFDGVVEQMKRNSEAWHSASAEERKRLEQANLSLGQSLGWTRDSSGVWYDEKGMRAYHSGGFIGGKPRLKRHEVVAKFLEGEYVTSIPNLDKLSLALPQLTLNSYNHNNNKKTTDSGLRPVVIHIDKLTPADFSEFMRTMQPYINSHK